MAYQGISTGSGQNTGTGDDLYTGAVKINSNFQELYNALGDGNTLNLITSNGITSISSLRVSGITSLGNVSISGITSLGNVSISGITSLGNVSISGITTTSNSIDIIGNFTDNINIRSYLETSSDHATLNLYGSRGSILSPSIVQYKDSLGSIKFHGYSGSNFQQVGKIEFLCDGVPPTTPTSGNIPGSYQVLVRDSGGVGITTRHKIDLFGAHTFFGNQSVIFSKTNASSGLSFANFIGQHSSTGENGTNSCVIYSNGSIYNSTGVYSVLSDETLKENIVDAKSQWQDIKALRVVNFNFKKETGHDTTTQIGLVAQEAEKVCPGVVETIENFEDVPVKGVKTSVVLIKALKALQEAMDRIEKLEQKLNQNNISLE